MARIADPEKMENIKRAVMECVIEYGYAGVSTALICEKAGVSPGYLYRYYKSKEELVQELVDTEMQAIIKKFILDIESSNTLYEAGGKTIRRLFMRANVEPMAARFAASVVMDFKIPAEEKKDNFKMVIELAEKCIELGKKTGETNSNITPLEMLVVSFTIPFRYLLFSIELDKNKMFTEDEIKRVAQICINAVK
ncbi:TetR/AcrR family transcriptional regulator [Clostridium saccharobutylicum]|uniref:Transcriptional regulator, TetR family n=4 Tax=Clostridium saccharobutylicum TaxID=169679 RepID=U5MPX9_CLOSA|nr:TetR/AcrR family transcriptional regulator [Clostridium saccharobutylicum]AGX42635.1 transcriptional regulator, TetR family [Clostridium saccharobutylicum DSM 13864]AQR89922.1 HTH-type transcriptional regulator BetI [Clostridium saccharobutylicum]AQR99827.1 HTH-type transcriptional regulator BetI [Clostridium saccharobutylicum]AQS09555.1 HTH-type transcriptional regulator BetI [Clostridium saccharobutylicum]AQS13811.1 HTH-type transcriptional regulator BetI [Clostridium saccharobutylicum]